MHLQLNILLLLCEEALATCELFRTRTSMDEDGVLCDVFIHDVTACLCNISAAGDVRGAPVCIDKDGAYYWYMADDRSVQRPHEYFPTHLLHCSSAAIYKEVPPRVDKKLGALMPGSCEMAAVRVVSSRLPLA